MEDKFNDMGVDAILGSEIMSKVGITTSDLVIPQNFEKVKDIMRFMKTVPPQDRSYFLSKVTTGKVLDKLNHVWGYIELTKKKMDTEKSLSKLKEEISFYEQ